MPIETRTTASVCSNVNNAIEQMRECLVFVLKIDMKIRNNKVYYFIGRTRRIKQQKQVSNNKYV